MIEVKVEWTEENVWEFVKFNSFSKMKSLKVVFIIFAVCLFVLLTACITAFFVFNELMMLFAAFLLLVIVGGYLFVFYRMLKKYAKQILGVNGDNEQNTVVLTDELIIVSKNNLPIGKMDWHSLSSIERNDKRGAVYVMTDTNALLLMEYKNITNGTKEELISLLDNKNAELPKKA